MDPIEHVALRPHWNCGTCGEPWPCEPARKQMIQEMRPSELAMYCWANLEEAAGDLGDMSAIDAFDRFLNWHRNENRNP